MPLAICALCGESKESSSREIEGREYDLCTECWEMLSRKLSGKGRKIEQLPTVYIPPLETPKEKPESPAPHEPPKIWFQAP